MNKKMDSSLLQIEVDTDSIPVNAVVVFGGSSFLRNIIMRIGCKSEVESALDISETDISKYPLISKNLV